MCMLIISFSKVWCQPPKKAEILRGNIRSVIDIGTATDSYLVQNANALSFDTQFLKRLDWCILIKLILCSTVSQLTNIYWIFKLFPYIYCHNSLRVQIIILISWFWTQKIAILEKKKISHWSLQGCNAIWRASKMHSEVIHAFHILIPLLSHFLFVTLKTTHQV